MYNRIKQAAEYILNTSGKVPEIAIVLGTNFDSFAESVNVCCEINYADIPGFPESTDMVHAGKLLIAEIAGKVCAVMVGRYHCYEGFTPAETVIPVRALHVAGAKTLLLTNAAGGMGDGMKRGDIMAIEDHINFSGLNALIGKNIPELGPRYNDMTYAYDPELTQKIIDIGTRMGVDVKHGVYGYMTGPCFETPAEIRALKILGASAVGMSTVHEATAASHMGMRTAGISCITNLAAGISSGKITGEEVADTMENIKESVNALIKAFVAEI